MQSRIASAMLAAVIAFAITACGDEEPVTEVQAAATTPGNSAPVIQGQPATTVIAGAVYDFRPVATDPDGDPIIFGIDGLPGWLAFNATTGRLTGTPQAGDVGMHRGIVVWVSDGRDETLLPTLDIEVLPASTVDNQAPIITGAPASTATAGQFYDFIPTVFDADGDRLNFQIQNRPGWASFDPAIGRLSGIPGNGAVGVYANIVIRVSDGIDSTSLGPFVISVNAPPAQNRAPIISGVPDPDVLVGQAWAFQPQASDPDGDSLSFEVFNAPSWMSLNVQTGRISGTPASGDLGLHGSITLVASDGQASTSLSPFAIEVIALNAPPVISGNPAAQAMATQAYNFVPAASDPNGDALAFSIVNQPTWASFDPDTGALSGTPAAANVGVYSSISITVDDGEFTATLGPFSINVVAVANGTATLSWMPPTENTDGSPLTDLAGFKVYWGTAPDNFSNSVTIANPGLTTYVVDNLLPGNTYYFTTTAFNSDDLESTFSNVASKTIP